MVKQPIVFATVPRLLPQGGTVLITGSGPSLNQRDVDIARSVVDATICVNDSYKLAPDADVLYAADATWWGWHKGCVADHKVGSVSYPASRNALKYSLTKTQWYPDVQMLRRGPQSGLTLDPTKVGLGYNGVHQSINVAVHLGATRIILLGVDMRGGHFFGHHPNNSGPPFTMCRERFKALVEPLKTAGVEIVNCTPKTALEAFPCAPLLETLGIYEEATG